MTPEVTPEVTLEVTPGVTTIGAEPGLVVEVRDLGATLHRLSVTGGDGERRNVALGHPTVEDQLACSHFLGGTIGRYANRIAQGRATVDGTEVELLTNDRGHHLHGGPHGLDKRPWTVLEQEPDRVLLEVESPDGDQGYPGTMVARAEFSVDGETLRLRLSATTDAPTLANLTSHVYLNLEGHDSGPVDDHTLMLPASSYVPIDATGIPDAGLVPVDGTPFDLRSPVRVGDAADDPHPQMAATGGFDHALVVEGSGLRLDAVLESARSRTRMELWSDQPAVQVYSGNGLGDPERPAPATDGGQYAVRGGIALEPELLPDTPHHPEWDLGSAVLRPGEHYAATIEWRFSRT